MKLIEKLKTMIYEEDEDEEQEEIAKKIDVEKTIKEEYKEYEEEPKKVEEKPPIIFDVEDFIEEEPKEQITNNYNYETLKKEDKVLYGGYEKNYSFNNYKEQEAKKEKFKPSLNISPVYGIINSENENNNVVSKASYDRKTIDSLFAEEKSKKMDFDAIRQKAYGETKEDESPLLYEMTDKEEAPAIAKITLGDAEEYFEDLGLEYNVDYTDVEKEQEKTRTSKNKNLQKNIDEEHLEVEQEKITDEKPEEKSLYDLIDMMYDEK